MDGESGEVFTWTEEQGEGAGGDGADFDYRGLNPKYVEIMCEIGARESEARGEGPVLDELGLPEAEDKGVNN